MYRYRESLHLEMWQLLCIRQWNFAKILKLNVPYNINVPYKMH